MSGSAVVYFDYSAWSAQYPALAAYVDQATAQIWFNIAGTLYLNNTSSSIIGDLPTRGYILNMLTAHLVILNVPINGVAPSGIVGRITTASQGSVSVTTQNDYPPGSAQWYQQTAPGSAAWAAMARFRGAQYRAAPGCYGNGYAYGYGRI